MEVSMTKDQWRGVAQALKDCASRYRVAASRDGGMGLSKEQEERMDHYKIMYAGTSSELDTAAAIIYEALGEGFPLNWAPSNISDILE